MTTERVNGRVERTTQGATRRRLRLLAVLVVLGLAAALPATTPAGAVPVGTGYSDTDWVEIQTAANYLATTPNTKVSTPAEMARFGVATLHYLLGITGKLGTFQQDYSYLNVSGPQYLYADYTGDSLRDLQVVMQHYNASPAQAQMLGAAFMNFIAGVDATANGKNWEAYRPGATPGAPGGLAATGGKQKVTLAWSPASGNVVDYRVEYRPLSSGSFTVVPDGTSAATGATVTGLAEDTAYEFRVTALSATAAGPAATAQATTFLPGVPAGQGPYRIMAIGDSITQGEYSPGTTNVLQQSFRKPLYDLLVAGGHPVDFVGRKTVVSRNLGGGSWTETALPAGSQWADMEHEGNAGWSISQLVGDTSLSGAIAARQPHVVLLHMGTNDLLVQGDNASVAAEDMRDLIDIVQAAAPSATIVLARIIPSVPGNATIRNEYNNLLATVAAQEATATSRIYVVDQATGFNPTAGVHTYDGIHPNAAGEAFMAQRWYSVLGRLIPN